MPNNETGTPVRSQSPAREDYIKAIYRLGGVERAVHTTELADLLSVRKPSVTGMLKRLAADGLLDYGPRQGARLTATGAAAGLRVVRRHRLIETFLVEMLGLDWSEVHDEAEVLEHHLSDRIVDALDRALGHPTEDPHGHAIPDADGHLRERDLLPLENLEVGATCVVREVHAEAPDRLQRWKRLGLVPGCEIFMIERHEFEDVMHIRVGDDVVVTGTEGVTGILVELS